MGVGAVVRDRVLTQIHGCFSASAALIRFAGLTVNILLMRFFASGVTVSHSGDGYCNSKSTTLTFMSNSSVSSVLGHLIVWIQRKYLY